MYTHKGQVINLILDIFERCDDEQGKEILRHALQHTVWPNWERQWPSAVPESEAPDLITLGKSWEDYIAALETIRCSECNSKVALNISSARMGKYIWQCLTCNTTGSL